MTTGRFRHPGAVPRLMVPLLLVVWVALLLSTPAQAKYAAYVIEADSGRVLHAANADTRNYPASLTKMMTLMLVFDALEAGKLNLDTRLPVSARAAGQPPSKLGLREGGSIKVRDAILALVTKSANDVATVVAEALGGSETAFARQMTAKARQIGMRNTTFRNASGLPNSGQLSTARDMAVLARTLIRDYASYYDYFATESFTYGGVTYGNHNGLLGHYEGTDGIKTGYIRASGFNLVASVKRNGTRLIGVVFGGRTGRTRDRHMVELMDEGFAGMRRAVLAEVTPPQPAHRAGATAVAAAPAATDTIGQLLVASATPPRKSMVAAAEAAAKAIVEEQGSAVAAPPPPAVPTGEWGIQVGAYSTPDPAWKMAAKAVTTVEPVLGGEGVIKVVPLEKKNGRSLYRARILGISEEQARDACAYLVDKDINCMALRMKEPLRVATSES